MEKRALVLSGGGSRGAYQAGVVYHLLAEKGFQYDIITGTSVGALNGAFLAMFAKGQEKEAAEGLKKIWCEISDKKVYKYWYKGILWLLPLLWKPSVYNTQPLADFVSGMIDIEKLKTSGKELRVGAVSLYSGERQVWTQDHPDIAKVVLASSSFPVFLEPIQIGEDLFTDDGVREQTPCEEAIKTGATHLDIVECSGPGVQGTIKKKNAINVALRSLTSQIAEIQKGDIKAIELYNALIEAGSYKAVGKRIITNNRIFPRGNLNLESPLDFDTKKAIENFQLGLEEARTKIWE